MEWNDWAIALGILSTLMSLLRRQWIVAVWSACFAVFIILDGRAPAAAPSELKYLFFVIGAALIVFQVLKEYGEYKKKLAAE